MLSKTRMAFDNYLKSLSKGLGYGGGLIKNEMVAYTPEKQQKSYIAASEQADFLKKINHIPVGAQLGERIGVGISRPVASRTNTSLEERQTRYVGELSGDEYHAVQTNFDTHIAYQTLDAWAHIGNFGRMYAKNILTQMARDRLMVGFNGESVAEKSNIEECPLLQDVNLGWLEKTRRGDPDRIMGYDSEGNPTADTFKVGAGGKYQTLDALVFDMIVSLMDAWHQNADDLVVLVGRDIWVAHGMSLLNNSALPTERAALQNWFAAQTVAGLPCIMPPFLPARAVWVTSFGNLSIYYQLETMRRTVIDNPKRDRVEEYRSQNEAYVVEDFGKFAAVRNGAILLPSVNGEWV